MKILSSKSMILWVIWV